MRPELISILCAIILCGQTAVRAEPSSSTKTAIPLAHIDSERDGQPYRVSGIEFRYPFPHADLPDTELLKDIVVLLSPSKGGWLGPVADGPIVPVRIGSIGRNEETVIYASALSAINQRVRDYLEAEHGLIGHLVTPDASEIAYASTAQDLRPSDRSSLTILVWRAAVGQVRTVAQGERLVPNVDQLEESPEVSNINRPEHDRLRERFDIEAGDLLTRQKIDTEIHRLNRHPGRRADAAIAPTNEPGEVIVDYLITEPKPWNAYVQISNTGTESTDEWRERFGFIHRQLTGRDDVLRLDYITSWFDETNAFIGSYEFDLGEKNRLKISGNWSEYTARDVGLGFENFTGESYALAAELRRNIWQDGPRFVDLVASLRFEHIDVENRLLLIQGRERFLLPGIGVRYEKNTPLHNAFAELMLETNWGSVVGTDELDVARLGRFGADENFTVLRGQLTHSFYLDPYIDPEGFKGEKGRDQMTLAHELALSLRGQWAFHSRLVPNFESVAGGAYSVRGYPESSAVGDDAIIGSIEYRYHLGRSTPIDSNSTTLFGQSFRNNRTRPYGGADWDLIFKGFLDVARVSPNDAPFFERAETLVGMGVGIEAQIKSNLTLRLDYGMALTPIGVGPARTVDVGDSRLHFMAQFVF
ncbi:MAG: ShlB/FhaC/HecB family hemolysin secretion/activation protein [Phycisphaerales bacterium JB047]